MPELPKVCRVELFGWECARERKIISALVDIPEFCLAQFDEEHQGYGTKSGLGGTRNPGTEFFKKSKK